MGCRRGDWQVAGVCPSDQLPLRAVSIERGLYVDAVEVTDEQYVRFLRVNAGATDGRGCGGCLAFDFETGHWDLPAANGLGADASGYPATFVTFADAMRYSEWVGARLPKESEFEYLMRFMRRESLFPWGDEFPPAARVDNLRDRTFWEALGLEARTESAPAYWDGWARAARVKDLPVDAMGLRGLVGNVREWCVEDGWEPAMQEGGPGSVVRGGSWVSWREEQYLCSFRYPNDGTLRSDDIGFRCVIAVER